jgi:hypothetical protein
VLRTLLAVDGKSPLGTRTIRDHFEHYDERIDDWLSEPRSAVYVDQYIGVFSGPLGSDAHRAHRAFDPSTGELRFRGESLNLVVLLAALRDIKRECETIRVL